MANIAELNGYSGRLKWFMALLLSGLAVGCGGGDPGQDEILGGGGNVVVAPTVTAVAPPVDATGVAVNSNVTAAFSKDMNPATINDTTFTLACPDGSHRAGTVSFVEASRVATFTPTDDLPGETVCTATITTGAEDTDRIPLANDFVWTFKTGLTPDTTRPRVTLTVPEDGETGVETNSAVTATFTEDMEPTTIAGSSFTLTGPGSTAIAGSVTYAVSARTATFTPTEDLPENTLVTATVTTDATDLAGNALAGNQAPLPAASDFVWTFTTGAAPDTTAPTITLENPADGDIDVAINRAVNATFSEAMDPLTITNLTFTLQKTGPPSGALIDGIVNYDVPTNVATFDPSSDLEPDTKYTATVTTDATDLAGNELAPGLLPNPWTFTTAAAAAEPLAIDLGSAASFGIAAGAGMTSTGVTVVNGDIALSPTGTCTDATGLPTNCAVNPKPASSTGLTVNGSIFFAGDLVDSGATAAAVKADLTTAWDQGRAFVPDQATVAGDQLASINPYPPGIRNNANLNFAAGGTAILDAAGDANAVWIFQVDTDFTDSGTLLLPTEIILQNGAQARNVWFVVGRDAVIGNGSIWNGNVLAGRDFTVNIDATMLGRALSGAAPGGAGAISLLDGATVSVPQ